MVVSLEDAEIPLPCKNCGRKTKKRVGWIKNNTEFTCICGTKICLDTSDFIRDFSKLRLEDGKIRVEYE